MLGDVHRDVGVAHELVGVDARPYDVALEATRRLITHADLAGATLVERHTFLERFGDATTRTLADRGATRPELVAARRLFNRLRQVVLEAADARAAA